jgi:Ca2+-transporting ATPase
MSLWGLFQGAFALALTGAIYVVALGRGMPADEARALVFFSLVIAIVALILVNRSTSASLFKAVLRPNPALAITIPLVAVMLAGTLLWPDVRDLFRFGPLHADDLTLSAGVGFSVLVALEGLKAAQNIRIGRRSG